MQVQTFFDKSRIVRISYFDVLFFVVTVLVVTARGGSREESMTFFAFAGNVLTSNRILYLYNCLCLVYNLHRT